MVGGALCADTHARDVSGFWGVVYWQHFGLQNRRRGFDSLRPCCSRDPVWVHTDTDRVDIATAEHLCDVAVDVGVNMSPTSLDEVVFEFPQCAAMGILRSDADVWRGQVWTTGGVFDDPQTAVLASRVWAAGEPPTAEITVGPNVPVRECSFMDAQLGAMSVLPSPTGPRARSFGGTPSSTLAHRLVYALVVEVFHLHVHEVLRRVAEQCVDLRVERTQVASSTLVRGTLAGYPFQLIDAVQGCQLAVGMPGRPVQGNVLWTAVMDTPVWDTRRCSVGHLLDVLPGLAGRLRPAGFEYEFLVVDSRGAPVWDPVGLDPDVRFMRKARAVAWTAEEARVAAQAIVDEYLANRPPGVPRDGWRVAAQPTVEDGRVFPSRMPVFVR